MNYTANFNLNKPEGTDLYNHLTVDNPNMDTIDAAMQANKLASVGAATELVSGTVHAITRSDSNQNIFKFKSTGDFKSGDTITVDGVSVNAYTTAGQQLLDDAYVLSAEVLCILDGTSLWILVNKTPDASEVDFDNTSTDLSSTNANDAIVEVNTKVNNLNNKTNVLNWGNYGDANGVTYPTNAPIKPNRTLILIGGYNARYIQYCNVAAFSNDTIVEMPVGGTDFIRVYFLASNSIKVIATNANKQLHQIVMYPNLG